MEPSDSQRTDGALGAVRTNKMPDIMITGKNAPVLSRSPGEQLKVSDVDQGWQIESAAEVANFLECFVQPSVSIVDKKHYQAHYFLCADHGSRFH